MAFDQDAVRRTAHLARLALPQEEVPAVASQLEKIMSLVEELSAISTEGILPMAHPLDLEQPLRPDQVSNHDERQRLMASAPATEHGLFLVPKVIE
ncbi:Asp-tRNA(Asn)/Glu-tRNA(Gln) amidotransferase subunit GatC [Acidithiobacillus thiooxidans]|jgi:aspartyl/glutamyl-tRNA(Asn/Gln) amidotransferase, C subunit|uniref:Aspartyl/glutamyl-tRNA(Asn/Gln) amidotransferase subunit C n=1 Tax=Acidithiobacillus thiooxidans ATCC 19377 TaxID=637390 RepID=A0A543PZC2_ACITH|nr:MULTISPECIES: Asp-tRNA(Asn)/Glu-tRNA(Gln) amidotransferase subunit GatC [Acidithiobacillus]MBE7565718.1 Asp-tRNA(Asn)/Glu-tRNA(Gln) amidotransferase subunit GatC [Acidithiobacillus sp. HP-11]MBU2794327.1 Asp-tRNA(Asn)/Glu-tRNA(Gln) amidotransferase subunit GatC [Acidithiobacillus thiooxidans]MDR7926202.1 Asp-tRNA(Asn)/Glu-tRNA(Gln) amidotransferase subunit GatC [Acidithiobacillus thiooxidans]MDX5936464.1 Asp-tRNA(Asn)/Glu-tRNA(Gln) amidotransferase subunit GatC [Acidithiobacillus thiooxidans